MKRDLQKSIIRYCQIGLDGNPKLCKSKALILKLQLT